MTRVSSYDLGASQLAENSLDKNLGIGQICRNRPQGAKCSAKSEALPPAIDPHPEGLRPGEFIARARSAASAAAAAP